MKKANKKFKVTTMRRTSRVFLNELNLIKTCKLKNFLRTYRDATQFFVDFFWQKRDFSSALAGMTIVHRGVNRFGYTTRLAQNAAKQAKEVVRSSHVLGSTTRPKIQKHTATLHKQFVRIEKFDGSFTYAVKLGWSGTPEVLIPVKATKHLNDKLSDGWIVGTTIRLGLEKKRLYVDFILEKPTPSIRKTGKILGLDSNYKNGLVCSDGQQTGKEGYAKISTFAPRQKHTYVTAKAIAFKAIKKLDLSSVKTLVIEDLRNVRKGTRGKFPRTLNRRLSHWLYNSIAERLRQRCEEEGIRLERKNPWKTSQRCAVCGKWDKRSRRSDKFVCVFCGHSDHADLNAAKNLEYLGLAGIYGFRSLTKPK